VVVYEQAPRWVAIKRGAVQAFAEWLFAAKNATQ